VVRRREKRTGMWHGLLGNLSNFEIDVRVHGVRTSGNRPSRNPVYGSGHAQYNPERGRGCQWENVGDRVGTIIASL
jgi:hypothetical protein